MKNKKTLILSFTAITLLATIVLLSVIFLLTPNIKVPDFTNMTLSEVESWIIESKIDEEKYEISHEFSEEIEKDYVIRQSIEPENVIKKDEILIITISDGKDPDYIVTIPDFTNKTEDEIEKWFEENLFTNFEFEYIQSDNTEKGKFVGLNVTDNNQPRSALILITISLGDDIEGTEIDMPDLKDYTKTNIQAWAKTNKITVSFIEQASNTIASGKVISQTPKAGTKIKTGSKVTVTISSGKGVTAMDFTGKSKKEAETWIKDNNLKSSFTEVYDGKISEGLIVSNSPSTGTIATGTVVKFNVSKGLVPIDNYTNKKQSDFESYINSLNKTFNSSAKIQYEVSTEESSSAIGTILSQTINGKVVTSQTLVAPGTKVYIKVARGKTINVTNKAGTSENDFKTYITGLGLKVGSKSERYDDNRASGTLISNDTGSYPEGSSINYVVSKGKYTVDVNSFKNKPYSSILSQINTANSQGAGYSITRADVLDDNIVSGNIVSCSLSGKAISCNVSKGQPITVKNYVGSTKPCTVNSCTTDNLRINQTATYHSSTPANQVISQDIAAGSKVEPNTTINLVVSMGPEPTPTPTPEIKKCTVPPTQPSMYDIYKGADYDEAKGKVQSAFKDFTNLNFIKLEGEVNNPNKYNGIIKDISPGDQSGNEIDCSTSFTIQIYGG